MAGDLHDLAGHDLISMTNALPDESTRRFRSLDSVASTDFGAAREDADGRAYNQAAFQYFLALEQKRSELAGRVFALLLVERQGSGATVGFEPGTAARIFIALRHCLRDTDFLGWYQEGLVIGAVLTHQTERTATGFEGLLKDTFGRRIRESLQPEGEASVRVRLFQPSVSTNVRAQSWP
jgi:hypothetical protein